LGAGPKPIRAPRAEAALLEGASAREAGAIAAAEVEDDYRAALTAELVRRAVEWATP
jgi:CO/xanthine dehydrogenase FAD-binding subunit